MVRTRPSASLQAQGVENAIQQRCGVPVTHSRKFPGLNLYISCVCVYVDVDVCYQMKHLWD